MQKEKTKSQLYINSLTQWEFIWIKGYEPLGIIIPQAEIKQDSVDFISRNSIT